MRKILERGHIGIFYRVIGHEDTVKRWTDMRFTTKHDAPVPKAWINAYYLEDIEATGVEWLEQDGYIYSSEALFNFGESAMEYTSFDHWTLEDQKKASLEAGVSAFSSPDAANEYASIEHKRISDLDIATFLGVVIRPLPEPEGYIVAVIDNENGDSFPIETFRQIHGLSTPSLNGKENSGDDSIIAQFKQDHMPDATH